VVLLAHSAASKDGRADARHIVLSPAKSPELCAPRTCVHTDLLKHTIRITHQMLGCLLGGDDASQ